MVYYEIDLRRFRNIFHDLSRNPHGKLCYAIILVYLIILSQIKYWELLYQNKLISSIV